MRTTGVMLFATVLMAIGMACAGAGELPLADIPYYPVEALKDGDNGRSVSCRLDVRVPAEKGFPTVVWFHGGGLVSGRRHFLNICPSIGQVTASYRFLTKDGKVTGDDCIDDAAAAVAWTLKNIEKYGGDPKKVYVSGMSAGGYLTMMAVMDPSRLGKWGFKARDLAGFAPVSGQATKHFNVRVHAGDKDPQFVPKIDRLAPLYWCSKELPPLLSVCGEPPWEWKARAEENRLLVASCAALGLKKAHYVECAYCDHGRTEPAAMPYLEMFILGKLPAGYGM